MRFFGTLVLVLCLLPLTLVASPAHAQLDPANSITLTEDFLTAKLLAVQKSNPRMVDLTFDLQPGLIVIKGVTNTEQPLDVMFKLVPTVSNGRLKLDLIALTIGQVDIDLADARERGITDASADVDDVISGAVPSDRIESVTVTDDALTITWLRNNPETPALAFVDNALTMTITEDYFNALPEMVKPSNPEFSSFNLDFRPDQAVLTTTYTTDGVGYPVQITYTPTIFNGMATWSVQAMVVGGNTFNALAIGQINDDIIGSWRMFFNAMYRSGQLTNIELTDDTLSLTWDADIHNPLVFDPDAGPLIVTESFINEAMVLAKPSGYVISNVKIDLQPGQAVLSANLNLPSSTVYVEQITFIPSVNNGYVEWIVGNVTLNGEPVDDVSLARFNETMTQALNTTTWGNTSNYRVTSITIDDNEMRITVRPR